MKEKQAHVSGHKAEEQCYNKSVTGHDYCVAAQFWK